MYFFYLEGEIMLFTSKGKINHEFLKFMGSTFYYTTGCPVSFINSSGDITPLHEFNTYAEPHQGYITKHIPKNYTSNEINTPHIIYLNHFDTVVYYPIEYHNEYLGAILVGPVKLQGHISNKNTNNVDKIYKQEFEEYENKLPLIYQYQLQYVVNLLNLVLHSSYFDPTVIATQSISETEFALPAKSRFTSKIAHHNIDQEENIVQQILLSKKSFKELAFKNISKLSNLVAPPLSDDPLRSEKNRFVSAATIISRAAIKLGMPSETAFTYSDYFIKKADECSTIDEVWNMQMSLFAFYREEVQKSRTGYYNNPITNMLLLYIEEHMEKNISLQEICNKLDIDYKYASNCFKKDKGTGFSKYFNKIKIEKAKEMLETTDLLIQNIAEKLGYTNAYYFTRTFKAMYGMTPGDYRKQIANHTN